MLVFVTYRQYQQDIDAYVERTATFTGKWAVQKELEKCEKEGNPMRKTVSLLLLSAMLALAGCESRQGEEIRQKEQAEPESSEADTEVSLMGSEEKNKNMQGLLSGGKCCNDLVS